MDNCWGRKIKKQISNHKKYKICVVTPGDENARQVVNNLYKLNITFDLLTISYDRQKMTSNLIRNIFIYLRDTLANIDIFRKIKQRKLTSYLKSPTFVGRCNSRYMLKKLRQLKPDFIILIGGGILKKNIIKTASVGVINAHPGLLPDIRGRDVVIHSILRDVPLGVTLHFIDEGIDTGDILEKYIIPIKSTDRLEDLLSKSDQLCNIVLTKFVKGLDKSIELKRKKQFTKFPLCRKATEEEYLNAITQISQGKALRLYLNAKAKKIDAIDSKKYFN